MLRCRTPSLRLFAGSVRLGTGSSRETRPTPSTSAMSLASSLPPLDFERFSQMSARRLEKQVAAMSFSIQRAEEAEEVAQRMAERRYVQAEAWRQLGLKREADVKAARVLLTQPNITLREPVLANEARRETARDSARREEMMRRREAANQALVLRDLRAKAVVHAEKEREVLRKGKEEQHEQLLERTQEVRRQGARSFRPPSHNSPHGPVRPNPHRRHGPLHVRFVSSGRRDACAFLPHSSRRSGGHSRPMARPRRAQRPSSLPHCEGPRRPRSPPSWTAMRRTARLQRGARWHARRSTSSKRRRS